MNVRLNGAWRTISSGKVYLNGAWRTLSYGNAYVSGAWRKIATFVQTLTLSISPPPDATEAAFTMTSNATTATPSGGLGPFTYAWSVVSSSGLSGISINSPTTASTTVTASVNGPAGSFGTVTLQCIATDSLGSTASATVVGSFDHTSTT